MERKFDIKDANDLLTVLNQIVEGTKNTKKLSDGAHSKVDKFVSEIKASWRDYLESAIIGNILFNNSFEYYLNAEGKKYCKELRKKADKKENHLAAFKSAIKPKQIGLFAKTSPQTKFTIKTKTNNKGEQEFYLYEAETRNEYFSLNSTLSNPRVPNQTDLIRDLDEKFDKREFSRETQEEMFKRMDSYFESLRMVSDEDLKNIPENDPTFTDDLNALKTMKNEYGKKVSASLSFERIRFLFNKYSAYLTPSTKAIINKLYEEIQKSDTLLNQDKANISKEHSDLKLKVQEKAFGSVKSNRIMAILTMLSHRKDSTGKDLSEEQIEELTQELKSLKETNPEDYIKGETEFENLSKTADALRRQEFIAAGKNKLDDSLLTIHEKEDRERYYDLYVARHGLEKLIPEAIFAMMYDKYLKMENNDTLIIGQMVHYYLGYLDYVDKMKEMQKEDEYKNWENYIDKMLIEDGFVRSDGTSR